MPDVIVGDMGQSQEIYDVHIKNLWGIDTNEDEDEDEDLDDNKGPGHQLKHARLRRDIHFLGKIFIEMVAWLSIKDEKENDPESFLYKWNRNWRSYFPASYSHELSQCANRLDDLRNDVNKGQEPTAVQLATELLPIAKRRIAELMPGYTRRKTDWVRSVHKSGFIANIPLFIGDKMDNETKNMVSELIEPWQWRTVDTLTFR